MGLVADTGAPTTLYQKLRNPSTAGPAVAQAIRIGYKPLYEVNEYCHAVNDKELRGLILQVTGLEEGNRVAELIQSTFLRLKKHADFEADIDASDEQIDADTGAQEKKKKQGGRAGLRDLRVGYTINLNLPATPNIEVFDAIFQSLRNNLLGDEDE